MILDVRHRNRRQNLRNCSIVLSLLLEVALEAGAWLAARADAVVALREEQ